MKIAVVGAGAMGSVYAGLFGSAGHEVWAVDRWREHIEAIREGGLRVEGASGDRIVRINATTDPSEPGPAELVILATKAMDVGEAAEAARPLVGPDTLVLSIQNGLGGPDTAARVLGEETVAVGVVGGFGASVVAPGHVHHHGFELVRVGERLGPVTPRIEAVADVWRDAGFTCARSTTSGGSSGRSSCATWPSADVHRAGPDDRRSAGGRQCLGGRVALRGRGLRGGGCVGSRARV